MNTEIDRLRKHLLLVFGMPTFLDSITKKEFKAAVSKKSRKSCHHEIHYGWGVRMKWLKKEFIYSKHIPDVGEPMYFKQEL